MSTFEAEYFPTTIGRDFFHLVCGDYLGSGISRRVYENRLDPTTVIKFEYASHTFQNIIEWEMWHNAGTHAQYWLAPCVSISPCGIVLIQKRATPLRQDELPGKVPAFLTDIKRDNWGLYEGRPVAVDYGYNNAFGGLKAGQMRKAAWTPDFAPIVP